MNSLSRTRIGLPDTEIRWSPGWDWLAAVVLIHGLVFVPWVQFVGAWPLCVAVVSIAYHLRVFAKGDTWRFALVEETAVLFQPDGEPAKLRGGPWMTESWVVVPTSRRVLTLRAGRYDPALFARLRRALLGSAGNG